MIETDLTDAISNVLRAGSVCGVTWYDTQSPPGTAPPFGIFEAVTSTPDDSTSRDADEWLVDVKVISEMSGGLVNKRAAASYAGKIRAAFTGPGALNVTGSLSGSNTCTMLERSTPILGTAGPQHYQSGYRFTIRTSKAK